MVIFPPLCEHAMPISINKIYAGVSKKQDILYQIKVFQASYGYEIS